MLPKRPADSVPASIVIELPVRSPVLADETVPPLRMVIAAGSKLPTVSPPVRLTDAPSSTTI